MSKQVLSDKELLLTDDIQKESKEFLDEVNKIYEVKNKLIRKKQTATQEIAKLERQLAELDKANIFETDPEKLRELAQKKKDIRYEIEEYKSILNTKYNPVIKDMLKSLEEYRTKANTEKSIFDSHASVKRKQYQDELKEVKKMIQEKIEAIDGLHFQHLFTQANNKYMNMLMDKSDW